jgi:hypothetical protein
VYVRPRGKTCDVLTEVAARLQNAAAACGPEREGEHSSNSSSRGAVGAVEAAAVATMAIGGQQQQQQEEDENEELGEPHSVSWMARAALGQQQQQQGGMVGLDGGGPRPDPSPSARLLVQAILEASIATATADAQQQG